MKKVVLNLKNMSIPLKVEFGRQLKTSLTANANFATPTPALTVLDAAVNGLETAYNDAEQAHNTAKSKGSILKYG